jgi:hypothetical protein
MQNRAAGCRRRKPIEESAMSLVVSQGQPESTAAEALDAELQAYNSAFLELELPWRWDVETFRRLRTLGGDTDCVGAYVERNQPHLLQVYEKSFLRDLILTTKARYHGQRAS